MMMSSERALLILLNAIIEVQKGLDWVNWSLENQYHTSTFNRNIFCELLLYVHCTRSSLSKKKGANEIQRCQNNYFLFNTSENIYIFIYFGVNQFLKCFSKISNFLAKRKLSRKFGRKAAKYA